MEIKQLDKKIYAGKKFTAVYKTNGYYDICATNSGFSINYVPFEKEVDKSFDDVFFNDWLEDAIAFGAFEDEKLIGYIEGSMENWNNRFRISNIVIFDSTKRNKGIGKMLLKIITEKEISLNARMMILETQSCNEKAIAFSKKMGFDIIGFDLYSYSNSDPLKHEIRIEMGKKLK